MGLAASQARLLSITSRLSDNELRTQLINNSKMRLATESSRVSEDYINALNSATMMMTNYDINGNEQTQALTFNTLTSYSPSNNQYGLIDTNGRILVSSKEAGLFEQSGRDLDKYLELHDLKYTTSYFQSSTFGNIADGGWYDSLTGLVEFQRKNEDGQLETYAKYSPEELKAMYLGGTYNGVTYQSYEASYMSSEYYNYLDKYSKYDEQITEYVDMYWNIFNKGLNARLDGVDIDAPTDDYNDKITAGSRASNDPNLGTAKAVEDYLNALCGVTADLTPENSKFTKIIENELKNMGYTIEGNHVFVGVDAPEYAEFSDYDNNGWPQVMKMGPSIEERVQDSNEDDAIKFDEEGKPYVEYGGGEKERTYQLVVTDYSGTPGFNVHVYGLDKGAKIASGQTNANADYKINNLPTSSFISSTKPTNLQTTAGDSITIVSIDDNAIAKVKLIRNNGDGTKTALTNTSGDNETEYFYVKLQLDGYDDDGNQKYKMSDANIYNDSACSSSVNFGNQVWDRNGGGDNQEIYNSDHWYNLQTFKYTDASGNLYEIQLEEAPGKNCSDKIKQTVRRAITGDELKSLALQLEEKVRLEIIKEQNLFDQEEVTRILTNCNDGASMEDKKEFQSELEASLAELKETVYEYLDSVFDGREPVKNADGTETMQFKNSDLDGDGNNDYQVLYEKLWENADKIGDMTWLMGLLEGNSTFADLLKNNETYNILKKQNVLEQLFDTFGEPKMCWIDIKDNNADATKKAEWYTNLFNKMKDGYKVLEQSLTTSKDWIQYALESGLATVVQVDKAKNWIGAGYKNIKEITEVVDDKAVAVAEAQYNKAMNDIENKDKRFDMELKNSDTEHNALQQEYETIKSVISKNVERTFKIYS